MQYSKLGSSGLIVSRLAFGAGSLGVGEAMPGLKKNLDQSASTRLIARAIDAGVTLFDTADAYSAGEAETLLGHALGSKRKEIVLTSKCGIRMGPAPTSAGLSRRHIIEAAEASLTRLKTDWIDVYHFHTIDPLTPLEETARACETLLQHGKIRYLAFSNWPAWMAATFLEKQAALGYAPAIAMQIYYSLVGRDAEYEMLPLAKAAGLGVMAWSPLAGGFLTGKYTRAQPTPDGGRRNSFAVPPVDLETGYDVIEAVIEIAAEHDCAPGHVAIAWLLSKPLVSSLIFGVSKESHLEDNLKGVEVKLDPSALARLDALTAPPPRYPDWILQYSPDPRAKAMLGMT